MGYWQEKIKIGNLSLPRFMGGPLDGITDSPFRQLVRNYSIEELLYGEMRHIGCIANNKGRIKALCFEQCERPLNYQVSANKLDFIEQACERILEARVDSIDLNIGCPAKNVIRSGSGSSTLDVCVRHVRHGAGGTARAALGADICQADRRVGVVVGEHHAAGEAVLDVLPRRV